MTRPPLASLRRLQALARMKADIETARLAATSQSRDRLRTAMQALGEAEPLLADWRKGERGLGSGGSRDDAHSTSVETSLVVDPALVRARMAHGVWIGAQRAHLNARLAMIEADWRRLHPVAAQAVGRVQVLDELARRTTAQIRLDQTRRETAQQASRGGSGGVPADQVPLPDGTNTAR